jgi:protein-disulfide isomerase
MSTYSYRIWIGAALTICLVGLGACKSNGSTPEAAAQDDQPQAEAAEAQQAKGESESSESAEENGESGGESAGSAGEDEAPAADLYPGMNFGELDADQRQTFVSIAEMELCPCPNSDASLHACLQKKDKCGTAKRAATLIAAGIQKGLNEMDILDRLAKLVEQSKKSHDFDLSQAPHKGPEDAPVKVVEFADFQCPHCKRASQMMDEIAKEYDNVAVYFKNFPLSGHGQASVAAKAAVAAQKQGKFWPMHDLLFKHQRSLSTEKIHSFARRIGLNATKFKKDMNSQEVGKRVAADRQEGMNAGIKGTPAIFINGQKYMGAMTKKGISEVIDVELEE